VNLELDHLILLCDVDAPEAEALLRAGLVEGSSNVHAGQGTANRRFFFQNAYLELLWVCDLAQTRREPAYRTRLWERWLRRNQGGCPFGIALRPIDPTAGDTPPFPTWAYHAPYLPARVSIGIAIATPLAEPEFLHVTFATRPAAKKREPMNESSGFSRLETVRLGMPPGASPRSQAAKVTSQLGLISFYAATEYVMELTFDGNSGARHVDLRPALPLVLRS
jgi:hypothetical protein